VKNRTDTPIEVKTKRPALSGEADRGDGPITASKRGRPIAARKGAWTSPPGSCPGKGRIVGDIVNTGLVWDVIEETAAPFRLD